MIESRIYCRRNVQLSPSTLPLYCHRQHKLIILADLDATTVVLPSGAYAEFLIGGDQPGARQGRIYEFVKEEAKSKCLRHRGRDAKGVDGCGEGVFSSTQGYSLGRKHIAPPPENFGIFVL